MAKRARTRRDAGSISFSEGDKFLDYRCPLVSEAKVSLDQGLLSEDRGMLVKDDDGVRGCKQRRARPSRVEILMRHPLLRGIQNTADATPDMLKRIYNGLLSLR
ncbi:hypothetical protein C4D60_Mb03t22290 [Musa balbisiana]|uniref:Uncharacterized protein n=1 Tax=Musa balbisiana TaxID=52838 RepID=A0A4S8JE74_MUSBA|nr:hypothetical protein C4D60_Mb03t22290 [Musa balbisiana]